MEMDQTSESEFRFSVEISERKTLSGKGARRWDERRRKSQSKKMKRERKLNKIHRKKRNGLIPALSVKAVFSADTMPAPRRIKKK